jgi:hypothetical protein
MLLFISLNDFFQCKNKPCKCLRVLILDILFLNLDKIHFDRTRIEFVKIYYVSNPYFWKVPLIAV